MHRLFYYHCLYVLDVIDVNCHPLPTAIKRSLNHAERSRHAHVPTTGWRWPPMMCNLQTSHHFCRSTRCLQQTSEKRYPLVLPGRSLPWRWTVNVIRPPSAELSTRRHWGIREKNPTIQRLGSNPQQTNYELEIVFRQRTTFGWPPV